MGQVASVFTHTNLVSGFRIGIGALLCALVVACGTSPKEASRPRSGASPSDGASSRATPKSRTQRDAQGKDKSASAAKSAKSGAAKPPKVAASPPPGAAAGTFLWPAAGTVIGRYNGGTNKGIDIGGNAGDPVIASAKGRVVYAGSSLRGYGNLVIIKHSNVFMTAYAHNRKILVRENEQVQAGQKIAEMGSTDSNATKLHFELRRDGVAVDPAPYLKSAAAPAP